MEKKVGTDIRDADRIVALALVKYLYNKGEISERVFRDIKKSTMMQISVENRKYLC